MSTYTAPQRAVIYTRISLDSEQERLGVERQEALCRAEAERRGWTLSTSHGLSGVYEDNSVSAFKEVRRESYEAMIAAVEAGEVDGIVAYSVDRLARRLRQLVPLLDLAKEKKIPILTLQGDMDLSTHHGVAFAQMAGVFAEQEVRIKGERQAAANAQRASRGLYIGRRLPWGYTRAAGQMVKDAQLAPYVEGLFQKAGQGWSIGDLTQWLQEEGVRPHTAERWDGGSVSQILRNRTYAGIVVYKGTELDVPGQWPSYVTREEQDRVAAAMASRNPNQARRRTRTYLLSKLLLCSCGLPMTGAGGRYLCSGRNAGKGGCARAMTTERAEKAALMYAALRVHTLTPGDVLSADMLERQEEISQRLTAIEVDRKEFSDDPDLSARDLMTLLKKLDAERSKLLAHMSGLISDDVVAQIMLNLLDWRSAGYKSGEGQERISQSYESVYKAIEALSLTQKRLLLERLGDYRHTPRSGTHGIAHLEITPLSLETGRHDLEATIKTQALLNLLSAETTGDPTTLTGSMWLTAYPDKEGQARYFHAS